MAKIISFFLLLPTFAFAADTCDSSGKYSQGLLKGIPCDKPLTEINSTIFTIERVVYYILLPAAGSIFVLMFMVGGVLYITSAGNDTRAENAKKTLTYAILGLLIVLFSYSAVVIFTKLLGGDVTT